MFVNRALPNSARKLTPLLWAAVTSLVLAHSCANAGSRETYYKESPGWLRAVGKLEVPGTQFTGGHSQSHRENCSATLISRSHNGVPNAATADTIVTAWHCLEFYNDLSKTITFTLLHGTGQSFSIEAVRLADGGGMDADWAVLRLLTPVPTKRIAALAVHPGTADPRVPVTMAGYSKNSPEQRLSYDPACDITSPADTEPTASNCKALKGASGGAVVQISPAGNALLAGVISQGDSANLSLFVPVGTFRRALQASLR